MKAIEYSEHGIPHEVCRCVDIQEPESPDPGELRLLVLASAINPADLLTIEGRYPGPESLPARQGIEGVGLVEQLGQGVQGFEIGDHVLILSRENWVEKVLVRADNVMKIPKQLDIYQAATMKANPPSAMLMLDDYVKFHLGDWVIQNAANSALGQHVIRLANVRGIRTINIVRNGSWVAPLKALGADIVMVDNNTLPKQVRAELGGDSIPLALDAIGGNATTRLADCLSDNGVIVNYGFLSGEPCVISPHHTIVRGIELKGFWLVKNLFQQPRRQIEYVYDEVGQMIVNGTLKTAVEKIYRLDQVTDALTHAEKERRKGKILFAPNLDRIPSTG